MHEATKKVRRALLQRLPFAPGVTRLESTWSDEFKGTGEALVAAGLVRLEHLPGHPGNRKTLSVILPDGTMSTTGSTHANHPKSADEEGAKRIRRTSKTTFEVVVRIAKEEGERRRNAWFDSVQKEREERERIEALPRRPSHLQVAYSAPPWRLPSATEGRIKPALRLIDSAPR